MNTKDSIRNFIIENFLLGNKDYPLDDNDSLLQKRIVDSIGVMELTSFLQKTYGIQLKVSEVIPENLDTVNNIVKFLNSKGVK